VIQRLGQTFDKHLRTNLFLDAFKINIILRKMTLPAEILQVNKMQKRLDNYKMLD
jgi:hypothetical protein